MFPTNDLKELDAGSPEGQSTGGTAYEWAIRSYFGRLAYSFKNKYLLIMKIQQILFKKFLFD